MAHLAYIWNGILSLLEFSGATHVFEAAFGWDFDAFQSHATWIFWQSMPVTLIFVGYYLALLLSGALLVP